MLNDRFFLNNMMMAPIEQLNIQLRFINKIFSFQQKIITDEINDKGDVVKQKQVYNWPAADRIIRNVQFEKEIVNCAFCESQKNIILTFPVFEIDERYKFIKLINMRHACDKCAPIVKINPSSEMSVTKRMAFILSGFDSNMYKRDKSPGDMLTYVKAKRDEYSKLEWDWDLTYLYRRSLSNIRIYSSKPVEKYESIKGRPAVPWSGVSNTDEYLLLDGKSGRERVVSESTEGT
jgi:hypothetical protein